jgi:hypothetical protein
LIARCIISNSFTHYFEASTLSHPAGINEKHNYAKPMTQNTPKKYFPGLTGKDSAMILGSN